MINHAAYVATTAVSTITSAGAVAASAIVNGQANATVVGGLFAIGSALIGVLWKTWRDEVKKADERERAADEFLQAELKRVWEELSEFRSLLLSVREEDDEG